MSWPSMTTACQPNPSQRRRCASIVVLELRGAALPQRVDVDDGAERIELVELGHRRGFPHRPFRGLAVAEHHVGAVVGADAARVERDAHTGGKALAERSGRDVNERQSRRRMAFEIGGELAQLEQFLAWHVAGRRPGRVENRRGMPFREHEAIGVRDAADGAGRSAAPKRTAPPSDPRPNNRSSDGRVPDSLVARMESIRSCVAMFFSAGTARDVSTVTKPSNPLRNPIARSRVSIIP